MKKLFIYMLTVMAFLGCKKEDEKYDKTLYIRGRAFYTDTISQDLVDIPLKNKKILLSDDINDTDNYMYSVITDADGYFVFNLLKSRKKEVDKYLVNYSDSMNSIYYSGKTIISGEENDIVLNVGVDLAKQNAMRVVITDSVGGAIPDATVLVYTSQVLAANNDPAGAIQTLHSDSRGMVFKFNLPVGNYYLTASKQAGTLTLKRSSKKIPVTSDKPLTIDSLQLR